LGFLPDPRGMAILVFVVVRWRSTTPGCRRRRARGSSADERRPLPDGAGR
jgi:hypothetical protein